MRYALGPFAARKPVTNEVLLLIVDDEPHIRDVVRFAAEKAGYRCAEVGDGEAALEAIAELKPDLVVLDIKMPKMTGLEVCRTLRPQSTIPIIFLTSNDDEIDRIVGLELGGDDYVTKPFSPRELMSRIGAVLRRCQAVATPATAAATTLTHGDLGLDEERFEARWAGELVTLTVTEFGLLAALLRRPGRVFSRDELMDRMYRFDNHVSDRTVDSHVRRVRRKFAQLGGDVVDTVHGVGYRLGPCGAQEG
ncbi:MAG: response regulator transcription factor [Myxococcales bacterium]|nr:response regulator transcription factor [Myxococcales bacterium]